MEIPGRDITYDPPPGPLSPWLRLAHIAQYRVASAAELRPRRLLDWELIVALEGRAVIWWAGAGGHLALPAGAVALVPPGHEHAFGCTEGSHLAVHFDLVARPDLEPMAMIEPLPRTVEPGDPVEPPRLRIGDLATRVVVRVRDLGLWRERLMPLVELYRLRQHRGFAARLRAGEAIGWALRAHAAAAGGDGPADPRLAELLAEVGARPEQPWRLAALRRRAGLADTAFRAAVQRATGETPRAWIEGLRLERAARLLLETPQSVQRIAAECGYADPFHFSRVFRRRHGVGPRAFRQGRGGRARG